jgi:hypothetical protein
MVDRLSFEVRLGGYGLGGDRDANFLCQSADFAMLSLFKKRGMVRLGIWSGGVVLVFVSALQFCHSLKSL